MSIYIPTVITSDGKQDRAFDIYSLMLRKRIILINGGISEDIASVIIPQLLHLNQEDPEKDIHLYVNSYGGSVYDGLGIIDCMDAISNDVCTYNTAKCMSMGAMILSAGTKGKRFVAKNSTTMIHAVSSGTKGTVHEMQNSMQETQRLQDILMKMIAQNSTTKLEDVIEHCKSDFYMDAEEALAYGIADKIIPSQKKG